MVASQHFANRLPVFRRYNIIIINTSFGGMRPSFDCFWYIPIRWMLAFLSFGWRYRYSFLFSPGDSGCFFPRAERDGTVLVQETCVIPTFSHEQVWTFGPFRSYANIGFLLSGCCFAYFSEIPVDVDGDWRCTLSRALSLLIFRNVRVSFFGWIGTDSFCAQPERRFRSRKFLDGQRIRCC